MANWQVISLDTTTPQLRAPGTGDGYSFNSGSTQLGVWTTTGLGVGTANPAGKLVVSNAGAAGIEFYPTGGVGGGPYLGTYNRSTSAYIPYTNYASAHTWFVSTAGNVRAMDLDSSGNVGIGTASPAYRFHVVGATTSVSAFRRTTADDTQILIGNTAGDLQIRALANGNGLIYSDTGKTLGFGSNGSGTAQLTLDTSGNLGIGTSSPTTRLEVNNGINNTDGTVTLRAVCGTAGADPAGFFGTTGAHPLILRTNTTERLRIDSAGNMGLGVTPGSWTSNAKAMQFSSLGMVWQQTNGDFNLGYNTLETSANSFVYKLSSIAATRFSASDSFKWFVAPSGTAGNAISFTQAMTLDANANLQLNTTTNKVTQFGGSATGMTIGSATYPVLSLWDTGDASWNFCLAQDGGTAFLYNNANGAMAFYTNGTERARIPAAGGLVVGTAALATNATDGFLYIPGCAGTPTGTPTALTGRVPLVVDTTNNKLYFYSGGAWRDAGP